MKVAIAPDSFKGVMTALEAAQRIERGLKRALLGVACRKIPMADGGEGTVRAIVDATGGRFISRTVQDPLGRKIRSQFGISGDGKTSIIEMAAASGLALLKPRERNPMKTTTFGTGELVRHALSLNVKHILIGIGWQRRDYRVNRTKWRWENDLLQHIDRVLKTRFWKRIFEKEKYYKTETTQNC